MKLSALYSEIGCNQKASFFKGLAYERFASDASKPHTSWKQCYQILRQILSGHNLPLDPNYYVSGERVRWLGLQREVAEEILLASIETGSAISARRHYTFLIQTIWWMITKKDRSA